jgi:hypothetical protein
VRVVVSQVIVIALCTALAACAPRARLKEPSPDGPVISALAFVPARTLEGCRVMLRFHFDARGGEMAAGVKTWMLIRGRAGRDHADPVGPASSGSLAGSASGDAAIPVTFHQWGTYRYYVQVEDEAGRWSNALDATIAVDPRLHRLPSSFCP